MECNQLSALHDTASKVALPGPKSSKLPAMKKKSTSESNAAEGSEAYVDEDEEDKKTRKDRKAKNSLGR